MLSGNESCKRLREVWHAGAWSSFGFSGRCHGSVVVALRRAVLMALVALMVLVVLVLLGMLAAVASHFFSFWESSLFTNLSATNHFFAVWQSGGSS